MKLEVIPARKLSHEETKALKRLTLGRKHGEMLEALEDWQKDRSTKVVRLAEDDGKVLCWALLNTYDARGNKDFQIYTRASERGKGYARMVYDKAVQVAGGRASMIVHPHDALSIPFYNKVHFVPQGLPPVREITSGRTVRRMQTQTKETT